MPGLLLGTGYKEMDLRHLPTVLEGRVTRREPGPMWWLSVGIVWEVRPVEPPGCVCDPGGKPKAGSKDQVLRPRGP